MAALVAGFLLEAAPLSAQTVFPAYGAGPDALVEPLTVNHIVEHLTLRSQQQAEDLAAFESTRVYRLTYEGFSETRQAEMLVAVSYRGPSSKDFRIETSSGSKIIVERVFDRLIRSEQEASLPENREKSAFNLSNYDFKLLGLEQASAGTSYVLQIVPRRKERFLYRGKIWVDAKDFAVVRIQAEPVSTPSFWTEKSNFDLVYEKVGGFWLPSRNVSETWLRFGGRANLTIDYQNYRITERNTQSARK